ncbi:hypothetical protein GTA08_BOTSDO06043 [Botryosphaeria dothidea]|uniref:Uncharacterized protein n=1 Tax=Botryosphaeria dothidea TaxID=55169 RepID=A0A8H4N430_9PEZI|nr:hypothetical protein GTA08_BOTSDO06043 [Botryosphaeria dothidea]
MVDNTPVNTDVEDYAVVFAETHLQDLHAELSANTTDDNIIRKKKIRTILSTLTYFRRHVIYGQDIDFLLPAELVDCR